MIRIDNRFPNGSTVFLKTDMDQLPRMIIGIKICLTNELLYELVCGTIISWHYEAEITTERIVF